MLISILKCMDCFTWYAFHSIVYRLKQGAYSHTMMYIATCHHTPSPTTDSIESPVIHHHRYTHNSARVSGTTTIQQELFILGYLFQKACDLNWGIVVAIATYLQIMTARCTAQSMRVLAVEIKKHVAIIKMRRSVETHRINVLPLSCERWALQAETGLPNRPSSCTVIHSHEEVTMRLQTERTVHAANAQMMAATPLRLALIQLRAVRDS